MKKNKTILLTDDSFVEKYNCINNTFDYNASFNYNKYNDYGCMFETYGDELEFVMKQHPNNIWTIIEGDDDLYIVTGYHIVNRLGYLITEEPFLDENEEYKIT